MKNYRVDFLVSQDFYEEVQARSAEEAIHKATVLAEDWLHRCRTEGTSLDVVKVEELV